MLYFKRKMEGETKGNMCIHNTGREKEEQKREIVKFCRLPCNEEEDMRLGLPAPTGRSGE